MKKLILVTTTLFMSVAILNSCGSKEEKKDDDKKDSEKKEEKSDSNEGEETSSSSAGATNWSQVTYDAYMNSCVNSAKSTMGEEKATSYCACTAASLQESYPDETTLGSLAADEIQKVAMECLSK